jgi:ADP-heptose:LPS heptosyltransferase
MGNMGDTLVSSIIFENIDSLKIYGKITFLISDDCLDLFQSYNGVTEIIGLNKRKFKYSIIYKIKILLRLNNEGFLYGFNLTPARTISDDSLVLLSGSKFSYALDLNSKVIIKLFRNYIDRQFTKIMGAGHFNEYEKNFEVIKFLSKSGSNNFFNQKTFIISNNKLIISDLPKILIAPFSSNRNRDWPISHYTELIAKLQKNYFIIPLASKTQLSFLRYILGSIDKTNIYDTGNIFQLKELPQLMSEVDLFLGGDSGMTHLALKLDKSFIAIIGGGNFGRFFPYKISPRFNYLYHKIDCFNCEWKCIQKEQYCITKVSVDDVYSVVQKLCPFEKLGQDS